MEPAARADACADEARNVIDFWREVGPERWFAHDEELDRLCRERFIALHDAAAGGALSTWEQSPEGAMALLILLDQMPRNMFRNTPRAWATDAMAQRIAAEAIARGFDHKVEPGMRQFFYLPFMHAEDRALQERSLQLYTAHGDPENLRFAHHHHDIVARFGRFPHRNEALGRTSTPEELAFLAEDSFRA